MQMKSRNIYRKRNNNFVARYHIWSLLFVGGIGFIITLSVLVATNIISYNIATQSIQFSNNYNAFSSIHLFVKRFIHTPELVLSFLGGLLAFSFRYMFYFGKIYS